MKSSAKRSDPKKTSLSQLKRFDLKFGADFIAALPAAPGVYRIYDDSDALVYVGKAMSLRRRLSQYRNAKRRKAHRKMRAIVESAHRIEYEVCTSERDALLLESALIQSHRPKWNIAGAFYFLYPLLGVACIEGCAHFIYTTQPELYPEFRFHGAFRSRQVTRQAYQALIELLTFIGHPVPWKKLKSFKRDRFSQVSAYRQLPEAWIGLLEEFFSGKSPAAMESLVLALVENAGARRKGPWIQDQLRDIKRFWKHEAQPLAKAVRASGPKTVYPISQRQRDQLFINYKFYRATSRNLSPEV